MIDETADTRSFVLDVPPALAARFAYVAGQFCTFRATIGGEPIVRCYSMSSSPETGDPFTVTVKRVPGGKMSNWMNDTLAPGDTIDVMPPAGRFVLRAAETPIVAFAGGSGITPVLSIIKTALADHGARDRAGVRESWPRQRHLCRRARTAPRGIRRPPLGASSPRLGERGSSTPRRAPRSSGTGRRPTSTCAAPGRTWRSSRPVSISEGSIRGRLLIERFELPDEAPAASVESETESIVIRLDGRKRRVGYEPGDTILDTARRAGLKPPFNCQAGSCGTCMAYLDEGKVTMRVNNALDADEVEEGWVLTCQAIPTSREVVVDYDR